jgi:hypothetical protein
VFFLLL